ncbi:MAG: thioredoxin domain-containing protein [Caenispirillum bisanense]|nr:thioredoxin domain-containing protein [Caenispirillum bisanense]MCA1971804.1 thioredoxin domain-containing protein [Caenispirillum sp.]
MNLLRHETSPYLLQHADNPVHWRPWGPEALAEARAAGKPVLLSVGYAACHWCHVMAHESFEDADTAAVMNDLFVNIKVDREERPDVDAIYQSALQLMGQHGGWPLTMFLTPEGEPFWGGTYFPNAARWGRPDFVSVLRQISETYRTAPDKVQHNTGLLVDALRKNMHLPQSSDTPQSLSLPLVDAAAGSLAGYVDPEWGGLRGAPKFPVVFAFDALWRAWRRTGRQDMRDGVLLTLDRMCQGGIYDHLGGGFARYSTDAEWLVPHFEKMLYDNAQLIDLMTSVWQETRSPLLAARIEETVEWLEREMIAETGAFAATLDADSEGEEGRYYVWTEDEIDALLADDPDLAKLFKAAYDVRPGGNWEGRTILHRNASAVEDFPETERKLARARALLLRARDRRVAPGRDDKVLADWNGLMIHGLARAGWVFDRLDWVDHARSAYDAIRATMTRDGGRLGHSFRRGKLQPVAMLDDYAAMMRAALTLHQVTAEPQFLDHALTWLAVLDADYADPAAGYFLTAADATDLILRTKTAQDNATPAGNGLMAVALATLWHLTGDEAHRAKAEGLIRAFEPMALNVYPHSATLLGGFELLESAVQVVVAGDAAAARPLVRAVAESPVVGLVLSQVRPGQDLPAGHPARGKGPVNGAPAAYICRGPVCSAPVTDPEELRSQLTAR